MNTRVIETASAKIEKYLDRLLGGYEPSYNDWKKKRLELLPLIEAVVDLEDVDTSKLEEYLFVFNKDHDMWRFPSYEKHRLARILAGHFASVDNILRDLLSVSSTKSNSVFDDITRLVSTNCIVVGDERTAAVVTPHSEFLPHRLRLLNYCRENGLALESLSKCPYLRDVQSDLVELNDWDDEAALGAAGYYIE